MKHDSIRKATKELANEAGIEDSLTGRFIFDKEEMVNEVSFTVCKIKNEYGFGFLLPKVVPIFAGRGKDRKEVSRQQIRSPAVLTSNPKLIEPSSETENKYKIKFVAIPSVLKLRMDLKTIDDYRNNRAEIPKGIDIFTSVRETYKKFLYFQNETWFDIHTLWDMATYFFVLFNAFPIVELRGLAGTAKSKVMDVSRLFTLNPTEIMVNPSEASLFRITHTNRPTKYIDEAEKLFLFIGGTWQSSPIVELINGSYSRGSTVPRLEKEGLTYKLIFYECYSPTMVGSIAGLRDATETRAITHIMTKSSDTDTRGELEVKDYEHDPNYQIIRNKLYLFALTNWEQIERNYNNIDISSLKKRDFQLWRPLLALAKHLDYSIYERVLSFAEKLSIQKRQDFIVEGTIDYRAMEYLKQRLDINETKIYMKNIAQTLNDNSSQKIAEKTVSMHLDKIGFKEHRDRDSHGSFIRIDKTIFDTIVSPICPTLSYYSPYSSYSSYSKGNDNKLHDESMTKNDENNNGK